jgi:hypothetical protein
MRVYVPILASVQEMGHQDLQYGFH